MEVGDPGRWANPPWWGNPPVHINSHFDYVYMKSGVTHRMLPHLSGVPHLYVNRERFDLLLRMFRWKRKKTQRRTRTYRILTFLLYHCTTTRTRQNSKIPKNLIGDTSKLSLLTVTSGHFFFFFFFFKKNLIPGWKLEKQNEANQVLEIRSLVQASHLYVHFYYFSSTCSPSIRWFLASGQRPHEW